MLALSLHGLFENPDDPREAIVKRLVEAVATVFAPDVLMGLLRSARCPHLAPRGRRFAASITALSLQAVAPGRGCLECVASNHTRSCP